MHDKCEAARLIIRHLVVIDHSYSACANCGSNAIPNTSNTCSVCGTTWRLMAACYRTTETVEEMARRFESQFPEFSFIGICTGTWPHDLFELYDPSASQPA